MKAKNSKRKPIFYQFAITLVLSLILALAFFAAAAYIVENHSLNERTDGFDYKGCSRELQEYITENNISSGDMKKIREWDESHESAILQVYDDNGILLYNGFMVEDVLSTYGISYDMDFSDKTLMVQISAFEGEYSSPAVAYILIILLSFFIFLAPVFAVTKKKMEYIETLSQEVSLLESGNLEYPVTIKGNDELSELAQGIESLRASFREQIEETDELAEENQAMVSRISHDLRTPLTAISLYADILENNDRLTPDQQKEYIGKITKKVQHMKDLSEHLLTYSKEQRVDKIVLEKRHTDNFFYEALSDFCSYLMEQGFTIESELEWDDTVIYVNEEAVERILNNMSSNLLKYADRYRPMYIRCWYEEEFFYLEFRNSIAQEERYSTGSGIGLYSVEEMMAQMQGTSIITATDDEFIITLQFKKVEE